jgi:hypothetical protein
MVVARLLSLLAGLILPASRVFQRRMIMLNSDYRRLCSVELPYAGRQKYMHAFDLSSPSMADGYEDYLEPVKLLCRAAGAVAGIAYMTVDEKIVEAGMSQRRPKPHVDGCFMPMQCNWGHEPPDPSPLPSPGSWTHKPSWLHTCNNIDVGHFRRMSVIVAASVEGCRAWRGMFDGYPAQDGDLSHIQDQLGDGEILPANVGYLLSPDCVHESMILKHSIPRSFLRIALPVDFDFFKEV